MTEYISAIKRQFRDVYHYPAVGTQYDPVFKEGDIPDGVYKMTIDDKVDYVEIRKGSIHCCNWDRPEGHVNEPPTALQQSG